MVAIAFYSITGQTKKFVVKTGLAAHEISDDFPQHEMKEKYILITPSYQDLKISLSFMEMAIYHSGFYAPLHLFGEGKLVRTTELTKLAIRATSFNAMYPGLPYAISRRRGQHQQHHAARLDQECRL